MVRQRVFRVEYKFSTGEPRPGISAHDFVEFIVAPELWMVEALTANRKWLFEQPSVEITELGIVDKIISTTEFLS